LKAGETGSTQRGRRENGELWSTTMGEGCKGTSKVLGGNRKLGSVGKEPGGREKKKNKKSDSSPKIMVLKSLRITREFGRKRGERAAKA